MPPTAAIAVAIIKMAVIFCLGGLMGYSSKKVVQGDVDLRIKGKEGLLISVCVCIAEATIASRLKRGVPRGFF
jgi:hypothetical protein